MEPIEAKVRQADLLVQAGRPKEAMALAQQVIAQDPANPAGYVVAAQASSGTKDAVQWMAKAVARAPDEAAYHHDLGLAWARVGRIKKALPCLERALALEPGRAHFHATYAVLLGEHGRGQQAEGSVRAALRLEPDLPVVRRAAATVLQRLGYLDEAEEHARRALASDADDARNHEVLGGVLVRRGRLADATASLRSALRLAPTDTDVQRAYALLAARKHPLLGAFAHVSLWFGRLPRPLFWVTWFALFAVGRAFRHAGDDGAGWPLMAVGVAIPVFLVAAYLSPRLFVRGMRRGWFDVRPYA